MSTPPIDERLLTAYNACTEGQQWLDALGGQVGYDEGLQLLLREERWGFLAWVFFRIPALRRVAPPEVLLRLAGPRHGQLAAHVDALPELPWLRPPDEAPDDVQGLVDSHLRRLSPFGFVPPGLVVPISRISPRAASSLLADEGSSSWTTTMANLLQDLREKLQPIHEVRQQAEEAVQDGLARGCYAQLPDLLGAAAGAPHPSAAPATPDAAGRLIAEPVQRLRQQVTAAAERDAVGEALWLLADVQAPSPFPPLLTCWRQGVWPVGLLDDRFLLADPRLAA